MNLNKVQLIGRLGRKPEIRTFPNGGKVANVSIATTEKWKDRESGQIREHTEWHDLAFNGRLADLVGENLDKGSLVYVEGSLRTRKWKDRETGLDRSKTEVAVDSVQFGPATNPNTRNQERSQADDHGYGYVGDPNLDERAPF
ncbi:single-stranded DNA-binding protein [Diaphorobacter sp. J5-51]|uniref:single-stranded DNA-binding protein n=1 Tax=Diaphorobacter sp. J5-51 TaxID=680496 RepID=UPI000AEB76E0|nr:single-stranded DNA-binding protein [Diaphorobacter sp. J5-51]